MRYLLIVMVLFCGYVQADNLSTLKAISNSLLVVDFLQTQEIASNDKYVEINPLLGKRPSKSKINMYFASALLLNNSVTKYMPRDLQQFIQYGVISIEAGYVLGNVSIGITIFN